jgi:hypothetical protein
MMSFDDFLSPGAFGDVINEKLSELGLILTITKKNMDPTHVATQTFGYPSAIELLQLALQLLDDASSALEQSTGKDQIELEDAISIVQDILDEAQP